MITRRAFAAGFLPPADFPDIRSVKPDLETPPMVDAEPAAGRRVRHSLAAWRGSQVYHALYLPSDWKPEGRYPIVAEYAGNGNYRNEYGDVSLGVPEGSNLGYGLSGGKGFLWICLPYVNTWERKNQITWWGDIAATTAYCAQAIEMLCERFGGDSKRVLLAGFSRGSIGCNFLGLRDDRVASLWRAFLCYSHYDGVRNWPYISPNEREEALERLRRLNGRPQFICHERSTDDIRQYLAGTGVKAPFEIHTLPFRNHNDAWTLRDIPLRRKLRKWVSEAMA
ncbi:MAG: hypothetical protein U0Q16_24905 [Bryobacteraceae bacterium]